MYESHSIVNFHLKIFELVCVAMNHFVRIFIFVILLVIVGNFNSNCFDPEEIIADIKNYINLGQKIYLKENIFTPDVDGYLGEGSYSVVWKGKKEIYFY